MDDTQFHRVDGDLVRCYQRFLVKEKLFKQQYSHIYQKRLLHIRPSLLGEVKRKWGSEIPVVGKIIDLGSPESFGSARVVVGTLFKEMKLKPNVLEEFADDEHKLERLANYVGDDDTVLIEDESGRVMLSGSKLDAAKLVTGVVMAIKGQVHPNGEFEVEDFCLPCMPPQQQLKPTEEGNYALLVSGLKIGGKEDQLPLHLLTEFIQGKLGSLSTQHLSSRVSSVILAGNSVMKPEQPTGTRSERAKKAQKGRAAGGTEKSELSHAIRTLDQVLAQISATVPVVVLPGAEDPANFTLPQQPMHRCLFPMCNERPSVYRSTNPFEATLGGVRVLGHSGQPVDDIMKYTKGLSQLEILQSTLTWSHLAPTAPDTLGCYPFYEVDPFVIEDCPHVLFSGNMDQFEVEMVEGSNGQKVMAICVPDFSKTHTAVLCDLNTLQCQPLNFSGVSEN
jgi:DNA polymerase delta subunit 2